MITITLNQILAQNPCADGWAKILHARGKIDSGKLAQFLKAVNVPSSYGKLADDEPFPLTEAFDSNGYPDVIWALCCLPEHARLWRKFAVWSARQVEHLMKDQRSLAALDVAWAHSEGLATDEQLREAQKDAADAADAYAVAAAYAYAVAAAYAYAADVAAAANMRKLQDAKLRQILEAGHWVD